MQSLRHQPVHALQFAEFDELAEAARRWNLDFAQLDVGAFDGAIALTDTGRLQLMKVRISRHVRQRGSAPPDSLTFGILTDPAAELTWRGRPATGADMFVIPEDGEIDSVSFQGFEIYTLTVSRHRLAEVGRLAGLEDPVGLFAAGEAITLDPAVLGRLRRHFATVLDDGRSTFGLALAPGADPAEVFETWFLMPLLNWMSDDSGQPRTPAKRARDRAVGQAEALIAAHPEEALTVADLCRRTGLGERTLQIAFKEHLGVSPKTYLTAVRLHRARRDLKAADPDGSSVSDIANRWGFWHLGQFARAYRRYFGELPSETLNGA